MAFDKPEYIEYNLQHFLDEKIIQNLNKSKLQFNRSFYFISMCISFSSSSFYSVAYSIQRIFYKIQTRHSRNQISHNLIIAIFIVSKQTLDREISKKKKFADCTNKDRKGAEVKKSNTKAFDSSRQDAIMM